MNPLLQTIKDQCVTDLAARWEEGNDEILAAIHRSQQDAQDNEADAKFNLSFSIKLDFTKSKVTTALAWSVKRSLEESHELEDPNQIKLPIEGEITQPMSDADAQRALKRIQRRKV
jgi:hypothetical protein